MDNTANFDALKQATQGAAAISAPASPLGASSAPELAALYQSTFQLPQSQAGAGSAGQLAGQIDAEQKAAAAKAAAEAKQRQQDLQDPSKYRAVQKPDGGYDWYAPDGKQVDIATLTQQTGTSPTDWIAGKYGKSQNPVDIQYAQDSKNLEDFVNAVLGGDTKKVQQYTDKEPQLANYSDKGGISKLINEFQQNYQRYYVPRAQDANAWGASPGNLTVQNPSQGY